MYTWGIAVDKDVNIYVASKTNAVDFATTPGAYQSALAGRLDAFVTKISSVGTASHGSDAGSDAATADGSTGAGDGAVSASDAGGDGAGSASEASLAGGGASDASAATNDAAVDGRGAGGSGGGGGCNVASNDPRAVSLAAPVALVLLSRRRRRICS